MIASEQSRSYFARAGSFHRDGQDLLVSSRPQGVVHICSVFHEAEAWTFLGLVGHDVLSFQAPPIQVVTLSSAPYHGA